MFVTVRVTLEHCHLLPLHTATAISRRGLGGSAAPEGPKAILASANAGIGPCTKHLAAWHQHHRKQQGYVRASQGQCRCHPRERLASESPNVQFSSIDARSCSKIWPASDSRGLCEVHFDGPP